MFNKAVHKGVTVEVGGRKFQNHNFIAIKIPAVIIAFEISTHRTHIKDMYNSSYRYQRKKCSYWWPILNSLHDIK